MADVEYKRLIIAGPMRWIALTHDGQTSTLAWFVKVRYTIHGTGNVLFARSDVQGNGKVDIFAVFGDNLGVASHLRDDVFAYTVFAGAPDGRPPAPILEATFDSRDEAPEQIVESMSAVDGTMITLSLRALGPPRAYVRQVSKYVTEVGAFAVPEAFSLLINGQTPVGQADVGPLAEAPPVGADLQNLWYQT
jgi:hypothetical protein